MSGHCSECGSFPNPVEFDCLDNNGQLPVEFKCDKAFMRKYLTADPRMIFRIWSTSHDDFMLFLNAVEADARHLGRLEGSRMHFGTTIDELKWAASLMCDRCKEGERTRWSVKGRQWVHIETRLAGAVNVEVPCHAKEIWERIATGSDARRFERSEK